MDNLTPKEIADEEMINQAFHELLNDYLATKKLKSLRRLSTLPIRRIKVSNAVRANLILCTRLPLPALYAMK